MNNIPSDNISDTSEQIQSDNQQIQEDIIINNDITDSDFTDPEPDPEPDNETIGEEQLDTNEQIDYTSLEEGTYNNVETMLLNLLETYEDFNTQNNVLPLSSTMPSLSSLSLNPLSSRQFISNIYPQSQLNTPSTQSTTQPITQSTTQPITQSTTTLSGVNSTIPPPPVPRLIRNNNIPYTQELESDISRNLNRTIPISMSLPLTDIFNTSNELNNNYINRFRNLFRPFNNSSGNLNEIINSTLNEPNQSVYKNVINEEAEKTIKIEKYKKELYKDQCTCMMTLNDFKEEDEIAILPCNHIFDKTAVLKWLKTEDARCPICRTELPSKEVKKNLNDSTNDSTEEIQSPSGDIITPSGESFRFTRRRRPLSRESYSRLFTNMINRELIRQEDEDLELAILESLRT
tara:strand:- start:5685 stop:6896 length:1212 start_codon:yes stop_codon:yes gene_type:complete